MTARRAALLLPVHPVDRHAIANLRHVLTGVSDARLDRVVVIEQRREGERSAVAHIIEELGAVGARGRIGDGAPLEHRIVRSEADALSRAHLVNAVVPALTEELVWIHDADLHLPFGVTARRLVASPAVAIKPFEWIVKLPERATDALRVRGLLPAEELDGRTRLGGAIGKASYAVDRAVLLALGGLHEGFVGLGDEGFELMRRLRSRFTDVEELDGIVGALLFRPVDEAARRCRAENKALQERLAPAIDADLEAYGRDRLVSAIGFDAGAVATLARRRERARVLRVTERTPPPRRPRALPGSMWAVTSFFNPAGWKLKKRSYDLFRAGLAAVGLPLLTVELAFGEDGGFELADDDADRVVRVRSGDVLWHKESLLNLGVAALPGDCDKVVWLDADVLFSEPRWAERTAALLEEHIVVQPFSRSVRLRAGETDCATDDLPIGSAEHEVLHGIAWGVAAKGRGCLGSYLEHGHSGYAWAARRELLAEHGLYDANILGNADLNIAHAMFGGPDYVKTSRLSAKAATHLERWAGPFHEAVGGSVGCVDGLLRHLWHGDKKDRLYDRRLTVLIENDYDPDDDLAREENGLHRWSSDKPELHAWCRDYFAARREDPELDGGAS